MNSKGEFAAVGTVIVLFVGIIVALSLYGPISQNIGQSTNTITITNQTVTFPAAGSTLVLSGQAASISEFRNASNVVVTSDNYTVTNYDVSTGTLRTYITAKGGFYNSKSVNVTYTYEPLGYATDSSSRSVILFIAVFAALAVLAFVIKKIYDDGLMDFFK